MHFGASPSDGPISACPKCGSKEFRKNSRLQRRQRYLGQTCRYNFSVPKPGKATPPKMQHQALYLYLEGMRSYWVSVM